MKLKFTPRIAHVIIFVVGSAMLALQYFTKSLENASPVTITGFWTLYGASIIALFQHNVMQPDDSTRNPGLMNKKSVPPPPMGSGTSSQYAAWLGPIALHVLLIVIFAAGVTFTISACAPLKTAVSAVIDLANAECVLASDQGAAEPNSEIIVCDIVDVGGKVVQSFLIQESAANAPAILTAHPVKFGHPSPLTAVKQ